MQLSIHRGANEIGGSCIEIDNVLFDYGLPLIAMDKKDDIGTYKLDIKGLYKNETPTIKAVFLTHAHPDHYGLLELINPKIPIYVTKNTYNILKNITPLTNDFKTAELNLHVINERLQIDNLEISVYEVDHSINGACAYKITSNGKTITYTGDIRFHGRKPFKNEKLINAIKNTDYIIMEGTTISRNDNKIVSEDDLIKDFENIFSENKLSLVIFSPQNLDKFITIYKSCLKTKKTLVIDAYTAFVLDIFSKDNNKIPNANSNNIKVYFAKNSINEKLAQTNKLWKYKKQKISFNEIQETPEKYVIKGNFAINEKIFNSFNKNEINIIYSMWSGYLDKPSQFDNYKDVLKHIHTSGHAYVKDLQEFVDRIKPKYIIPIHTDSKDRYKELFNAEIKLVENGETIKE